MRSCPAPPPRHQKDIPTLALLTILLLGPLLFGRSCLALECYYCFEQQGEPSPFENCLDGDVPRYEGQISKMTCNVGEVCHTSKVIYEGQLFAKLSACFLTDEDDKCRLEIYGDLHCYQAPKETVQKAQRECVPSGQRSIKDNSFLAALVGVPRMMDNTTMSSSPRVSAEDQVKYDNSATDHCTCTTDLCNGPCKCNPRSGGGSSGSGGAGSGSGGAGSGNGGNGSGPFGLMITPGLTMITLVSVLASPSWSH